MRGQGRAGVGLLGEPDAAGPAHIHDASGYWDPVMAAACNETGVVVCMHIGSSSVMPKISAKAPFVANMAWGASAPGAMLAWLLSGLFSEVPEPEDRAVRGQHRVDPVLPRARRVRVRAPALLERAGPGVHMQTTATGAWPPTSTTGFDIRQTYLDHIYGCFIDDKAGIAAGGDGRGQRHGARSTTPTPTPPGPTPWRGVKNRVRGTSRPRRRSRRSCRATPSGSSGSRPPSRPSWPVPDPERTPTIVVDRELLHGQRDVHRLRGRTPSRTTTRPRRSSSTRRATRSKRSASQSRRCPTGALRITIRRRGSLKTP